MRHVHQTQMGTGQIEVDSNHIGCHRNTSDTDVCLILPSLDTDKLDIRENYV